MNASGSSFIVTASESPVAGSAEDTKLLPPDSILDAGYDELDTWARVNCEFINNSSLIGGGIFVVAYQVSIDICVCTVYVDDLLTILSALGACPSRTVSTFN